MRVRKATLERMSDEWSLNGGATRPAPAKRGERATKTNWRIQRYGPREVVAIEPDREYETPFYGEGAFWAAVEHAAAELKKDR